jgi:anthranilate synthase component 2
MKKILLIDNYDSFTYNLVQQIQAIEYYDINVKRNDEVLNSSDEKFDILMISPGPKTPKDAGISNDLIRKFHKKVSILGVCLGMQCINEVFGGVTAHAPLPLHGKKSFIKHNERDIFQNVPNNIEVARYHSLIVDEIPECLEVTASTEDNVPMALKHKDYPVFGVQFHPESFMTESGSAIMKNFLNI